MNPCFYLPTCRLKTSANIPMRIGPRRNPSYPTAPEAGGISGRPAAAYLAGHYWHRSKREQDAPIPRRDMRNQQRERRGKEPVQGRCPYVVAEAHPAEKTGRCGEDQKI